MTKLQIAASKAHLVFDTYSPGDGTRYRFWLDNHYYTPDYFADAHRALYTALGIGEAKLFIKIFEIGYNTGHRNG